MRATAISSQSWRTLMAVLAMSLLIACKVPDDPEGTTEEVTGGILRVGALVEPLDQADSDAVARIASAMQAETELVTGDPHTLFVQLENGKLHIIAGRIPANTPFAADVALSNPLGRVTLGNETEDRALAIRKGENRFLITVNRAIRGMVE
ncbi:enoyl-CoA hydratase [Roseovarius sp. M141]|uniref:enoyl-CoA hydratase n=1 Tax=Roseovarius sp. M141 TaxID=2583806 RepID=UPI0020CB7E8F|nr:enoyl-CoA hydratase [Roseovarius sp. M141]MCQ0090867.1 enoyl-CoA hydratase [Roseovarius sp. M141]